MLISVRDSHLGSLDDIAKAAEQAGMDVDTKMAEIGVVSGLIDADRIDRLRAIEGVQDVEVDKKFTLPPG
jgi:cell division protein ZapA (FtsZ GTPase activity inhibitor)